MFPFQMIWVLLLVCQSLAQPLAQGPVPDLVLIAPEEIKATKSPISQEILRSGSLKENLTLGKIKYFY